MTTKITADNIEQATLDNLGSGPLISNVQIASNAYVVLDDTAVSLDGGFIIINGSKFDSNVNVLIDGTPAISVSQISPSQIRAEVPPLSAGSKIVYLVNTDTGATAIRVNGLTYSGTPTWVTGSSLTGSVDTPFTIQLNATSDSNVSYSLASGSFLPEGVTLAANGLLSGTVTGITDETVYNFTVEATDEELQNSPRTFSLTIITITNNTHGWLGGGRSPTSLVDRIDFSSDTSTASVRGPLSAARYGLSAAGNKDYGWWTGGGWPSSISRVERITFVSDTGTASTRGPMTATRYHHAMVSNLDFGYSGGSYSLSSVDRITFASDTGTTTLRGPLSAGRGYFQATGNSGNSGLDFGWFAGGGTSYSNTSSTIDRIQFSNDNTTASIRGPLSVSTNRLGALGNKNYGWFGGLSTSSAASSRIERITYNSDTVTASVRGPLSAARYTTRGSSNQDYGWFSGGSPATSRVDRIDLNNDTGTTSVRGPLSLARGTMGSTAGKI